MGIEDLVSMLMQNEVKPDFSEGDPYGGFAGIADSIGNTFIQGGANGTFDTKDTVIGALVSGLLGGGLGDLSTGYKNDAKEAYKKAAISSYYGGTPEQGDLSDKLFTGATNSGRLLKLNEVTAKNEKIDLAAADAILKNPYAKDKILAAAAELKAGGTASRREEAPIGARAENSQSVDPTTSVAPKTKTLEDYLIKHNGDETLARAEYIADLEKPGKLKEALTKEENETYNTIDKLPAVSSLKNTATGISKIRSLANLDSKTSDIPFIYAFVQGQDGGVVKEGEFETVKGSSPILQKYANILNGRLAGGSELGIETKQQMLAELMNTHDSLLEEAKIQSAPLIARAQKRGVTDIANVLPFDPDGKFTKTKTTAPTDTSGGTSPNSVPGTNIAGAADQAAVLADAQILANKGMSQAEIAQALRLKYTRPTSPGGAPLG